MLQNGTNTVRLIGDIYRIENIRIYDKNTHDDTNEYIISKIDCSKMKSNNFHRVTRGLKINEIIYPQACIGDIYEPAYNFEAPDSDFTFLAKNDIHNPEFGNLISNKNLNKILNIGNIYAPSNTNFENRSTPYTIGSFYYGVNNFHYDIGRNYPKYVGYMASGNEALSLVIRSEEFTLVIGTNRSITIVGETELFGYIHELFSNLSFEGITSGKIYYYNSFDFDTSLYPNIEFIQVAGFFDVPFKYAAYDINDVKNFDENGNVID